MDVLEVLERIPAIAEAMQRVRADEPQAPPSGPCTLLAREPGRPGATMQLPSYSQGRVLALELSELGFEVVLHDNEDRLRLHLWPRGRP